MQITIENITYDICFKLGRACSQCGFVNTGKCPTVNEEFLCKILNTPNDIAHFKTTKIRYRFIVKCKQTKIVLIENSIISNQPISISDVITFIGVTTDFTFNNDFHEITIIKV